MKADIKGLSDVKFKQLLAANNLVEVIVLGNGFCFLSTLLVTLGEHGINKDMNNLSIELMNEIRNNMEMCKEILPMESEGNILKACEAFFQEGIYSHEFVDFCIAASANANSIPIYTYFKEELTGLQLQVSTVASLYPQLTYSACSTKVRRA